jgi:hypothetical protein
MNRSVLVIVALAAGSLTLPAQAGLLLSVSPAAQTVSLGDQVSIDLLFTGLEEDGQDEVVSSYDLTFSFDNTILSYASGSYFDLVDIPPSPDFSVPGQISWNSTSFADDATLQAQQGNSVTLATLYFGTLSTGTAPFTFTFDDVSGLGAAALTYSVGNGSVTVEAVPLPATAWLLGSGVLGMLAFRRRRAAAR